MYYLRWYFCADTMSKKQAMEGGEYTGRDGRGLDDSKQEACIGKPCYTSILFAAFVVPWSCCRASSKGRRRGMIHERRQP